MPAMLFMEFLGSWRVWVMAALIVGAVGGFFYLKSHYQQIGYDLRVAEEAAASAKAELERKGDDAVLQALSDYDLCVLGLRGNGMPVGPCDQLRGVRQ